jgi:hypothetical protein
MNNLKQLGLATLNCNDTYNLLPPAFGQFAQNSNYFQAQPHVFLLPFLEQQNLWNLLNSGYNSGVTLHATVQNNGVDFKGFVCPADSTTSMVVTSWANTTLPTLGRTSYGDNVFVFGGPLQSPSPGTYNVMDFGYPLPPNSSKPTHFMGESRIPASIPDGTSNTILWTEVISACLGWQAANYWCFDNSIAAADYGAVFGTYGGSYLNDFPQYYNTPAGQVQNPWPGGQPYFMAGSSYATCSWNADGTASSSHTASLLAGLGDGSVRVISQGMSQSTFGLALVPNDGLPLPSDW